MTEKLDELEENKHPYQEKEPLKPFPNNTNPETGEVGGPRGPEPTRYGDWERKGRVTDFWISPDLRAIRLLITIRNYKILANQDESCLLWDTMS